MKDNGVPVRSGGSGTGFLAEQAWSRRPSPSGRASGLAPSLHGWRYQLWSGSAGPQDAERFQKSRLASGPQVLRLDEDLRDPVGVARLRHTDSSKAVFGVQDVLAM